MLRLCVYSIYFSVKGNMLTRTALLTFSAIALLISIIAPWITIFGVVALSPTNSIELAIVIGGCFVLVGFSALTMKYTRTISIAAGIAVLIETAHTLIKIQQNRDEDFGAMISPGWGLYLAFLTGLFLIASTWIARDKPTNKVYVSNAFNPYGRCDTCSAPCNANGCTNNANHKAAIEYRMVKDLVAKDRS